MITFIKYSFELVKNSNIIVSLSLNPGVWRIKPFLGKVKKYNDDWLTPSENEYRATWLFLNISLFRYMTTTDDCYLNLL